MTKTKGLTFKHSGDLGDIIYALPTIIALGGGTLYLDSKNSKKLGANLTKKSIEKIRPLLEAQPYIDSVRIWRGESVTHDLDQWRNLPNLRFYNLADQILSLYQLPSRYRDNPWIFVDPIPEFPYQVVLARSKHRHSVFNFPWLKFYQAVKSAAIFVGLEDEHLWFCQNIGKIPYYPTPNFFDLAQAIVSAKRFIGNQSFPYAIAEAVKMDTVLEVSSYQPHCIFNRKNALYI